MESTHDTVLKKAKRALEQGTMVAAICGATIGLAMKGLMNHRNHTSNNLEYLKMIAADYSGEKYYKNEMAVTDDNLITASGIAPLEFAAHIIKALDVFEMKTLQAWYKLNKTQEPKYYFELME